MQYIVYDLIMNNLIGEKVIISINDAEAIGCL